MAKVITLKQPWAELVVTGHKRIETRSFQRAYRGELYIHSSAHFDFNDLELIYHNDHFKAALPTPHQLPVGKIVGKVELTGILPIEHARENLINAGFLKELEFGDYSDGRFAWLLDHAIKFKNPLRIRGNLGIWDYDDRLLEDLIPV